MTTTTTVTRPAVVKDEHLTYLDDLQWKAVTNMFGAAPYLVREFGLSRPDAKDVVLYWMQTYDERHP